MEGDGDEEDEDDDDEVERSSDDMAEEDNETVDDHASGLTESEALAIMDQFNQQQKKDEGLANLGGLCVRKGSMLYKLNQKFVIQQNIMNNTTNTTNNYHIHLNSDKAAELKVATCACLPAAA